MSGARKGIGGHTKPNRGATDDWLTPRRIVEAMGRFDLDPCACDQQPWRCAETAYSHDGLVLSWFGRVWLNPPDSKAERFMERMADHGNGIALLFARTETAMFHRYVWEKADALLFIKGRLHFRYPDGTRAKGNAGGPSVLIAYGWHNSRALEESGLEGAIAKATLINPS